MDLGTGVSEAHYSFNQVILEKLDSEVAGKLPKLDFTCSVTGG